MKYNFKNNLMRKLKPTVILALLTVLLLATLYAASIQCEWTGIEKIIAVGDLHGDYDSFVKILKGTGLIDDKLHWTGGKTHLVQIGDVLDRGDKAKEIFDLILRLEKEAEEAGGKVHMLLGNHEEVNLAGIAFDYRGYVTTEQLKSFLPDSYRANQEKKFKKKIGKNTPKLIKSDSSLDNGLDRYWEDFHDEVIRNERHPARKQYIRYFNKKYGKWLLEQNAVIKINDIIFVHGGISERFSTWPLKDINYRLRLELADQRWAAMTSGQPRIGERERQIVYKADGPLWYRDLARLSGKDFEKVVDRILDNLQAQHMVIAHTPKVIKSEDDMKRFGGKIWIIDTGISEIYRRQIHGRLSALIIEKGKFSAKLEGY